MAFAANNLTGDSSFIAFSDTPHNTTPTASSPGAHSQTIPDTLLPHSRRPQTYRLWLSQLNPFSQNKSSASYYAPLTTSADADFDEDARTVSNNDKMTFFPDPPSTSNDRLNNNDSTWSLNQAPYTSHSKDTSSDLLGTAEGVFLPTWLSIWSIMLFLRLGYCVGQAGLYHTIAMFCIGYLLAFLTTLSVAAISSNGIVKQGGPYYMISRSIGMEFGGCLGLIFYSGSILSGALNVFGAIEPLLKHFGDTQGTVAQWLPQGQWWQFLYGSVLLFICMCLCMFGSKGFARTSKVLFVVLAFSTFMILLSFLFRRDFKVDGVVDYTGLSMQTFKENEFPAYTTGMNFSKVFGIIYPSCTGILAGASLSGDLRTPSKSIPVGTLYAVLVTFVSYIVISFLIAATTSRETLISNFTFLSDVNLYLKLRLTFKVNFVPAFVMLGMYATSIFAIIGGIITTSKILQALARDQIISLLNVFGRGRHSDDEPILAILLTWMLIQLCLFAGEINSIVPTITILTLLSYGIINVASFLLKVASAPNFRPTFVYFHWVTALLGSIGCFMAMYFVAVTDASLATVFTICLWIAIHFNSTPKSWGDIHQALIYHQVRKYLLRLDARKTHVKYWRPQILYLVHDRLSHSQTILFANALKKGSLYILAHVMPSQTFTSSTITKYTDEKSAWMDYVDKLGVKSFTEVIVAPSVRVGGRIALANTGLGGMKPNILLLGWKNHSDIKNRDRQSLDDYVGLISDALLMNKSVAIARGMKFLHIPTVKNAYSLGNYWLDVWSWLRRVTGNKRQNPNRKFIDLYPLMLSNDYDTFAMVLQMGCVLHMVKEWSETNFILRVICVVERESHVQVETDKMQNLLQDLRIRARVICVSLELSGLVKERASLDVMFDDSGVNNGIQLGMSKSLQSYQDVKNVSVFHSLSPLEQARVINILMHRISPPIQTSVILTSLPSPPDASEDSSSDSSMLAQEYLKFIDMLSYGAGRANEAQEVGAIEHDLPPVLMIHGKGTVLTTSL